jgi:peptide/nickel transport system substrate-binding protein/oligopeptide transport system substrate-binding protein
VSLVLQKRNNLKRASLLIFTIIFLAVTAPAAYSSGIFRFPLFWSPDSFDPALDTSNSVAYIVQQVGDGLVAYDKNLRVVPGLAKSWKVSRDGREYLFTLRQGVKFHNGDTMNADDVVASFLRVFRSGKLPTTGKFLERIDGAGELLAGRADTLAGLQAVSDNRVRVRLTEPYAPFLSSLAMPLAKIMPAEIARSVDDKYGKHPVGTGSFIFHSWSDDVIVLKANRDYFMGPPLLDEVHFVMYGKGDRDKAMGDFLEGKLEGTPLPGSADPDELRKNGHQVIMRPRLSILFYGMNVNVPPYDNPDLRMALALATDRKTNVEIELGGLYAPAHQILPLGMPGSLKGQDIQGEKALANFFWLPPPTRISRSRNLLSFPGILRGSGSG